MLLPNKAKLIASVALLSLGTLGSQVFFTPKAQAQSANNTVHAKCNQATKICTVKFMVNGKLYRSANAVVRPNYSGITIPAVLARQLLKEGKVTQTWTRKEARSSRLISIPQVRIKSITVGNREYHNVIAGVLSETGSVVLGQNYLERY